MVTDTQITLVLVAFTLIQATALADQGEDPYRLNPSVRPTAQQIEMTIDPTQERYAGVTSIQFTVDSPVQSFSLHAQDMKILNVRIGGIGEDNHNVRYEQMEHALLRVSAGKTLETGEYELTIQFEDDFNTDSVSMYRVEEQGRYHVFTQMEASEAREAFPCFDEPAFKIPWTLSLTVPREMIAITNTPEFSSTSIGEMKEVKFEQSAPMSSYLVAIAVGDFDVVSIDGMSVPGRVVTTKGKLPLTDLAVESTPRLLAGLEEYFDDSYPYQKLDLIATPEFWYGAMENPGAIVYLDRAILIDKNNADAKQLSRIIATNAHELAHQWFGDVVTMDWWVDLWLNESFASWMGDKIVARSYPELDIEKSRMSAMFRTMDLDSRPSSRPIRTPRKSTDNFLNDIRPAYSKGRVVISMFEKAIGESAFRSGILEYMKRHRWGNASALDFADAIGVAANFDVPEAFASFMHQPGVPLVEIKQIDDKRISISQRRFKNAGDELPDLQWLIPISLKYSIDGQTYEDSLFLDSPSKIIALAEAGDIDWIYPNATQGGYYRWQLEPHLVNKLAENAQDILSPLERMGLVTNLSAMLQASMIDAEGYLAALQAFSKERDPFVMDVVLDQLLLVRDALVSDTQQDKFSRYVVSILAPALGSLGQYYVEGESIAATTVRPRLIRWLIRDGRHRDLTENFLQHANGYLDKNEKLHASLVPAALTAAAIRGNVQRYAEFKTRFENASTPDERTQFLVGLTDFEDPEILEDLQEYSLGNDVRPREIMTFREELTRRPATRNIVVDHALGNYARFRARLPGNGLAVVPSVAKGCSLERARRAQAFFAEPDNQVSGTTRILETTLAAVDSCSRLRSREQSSAADFFSRM